MLIADILETNKWMLAGKTGKLSLRVASSITILRGRAYGGYIFRNLVESIFHSSYLAVAMALGIAILVKARNRRQTLFGIMSVILVAGDALQLIPRIISLNSSEPGRCAFFLGFGALASSVAATVFYALFYGVWKQGHINERETLTSVSVHSLSAIRILLCLLPQNEWMKSKPPHIWSVLRNIPLFLLGGIIAGLFFRKRSDPVYGRMWMAIAASFAFFIPAVLLSEVCPAVEMLMLPKACAYIWMMWIGFSDLKEVAPAQIEQAERIEELV
ncbi:MAG: hypothetical protein LBU32_31440 [Clostridiales bacterium]|nr:hypothetical protein [Clostridiales bacterium]